MLRSILSVLLAMCVIPHVAWAVVLPEEQVLSEYGSNRSTAYGSTNKIVSFGDKTHVAWLDYISGSYFARIRTFDKTTGQWSPVYTLGQAQDNHGGPALTVDSQGYLHTAFYPHHGAFRYRKSVNPNDASQWSATSYVGTACTYPNLMVGPDDTLYLIARESNVTPWVNNLYTKTATGSWSSPTAILQADLGGYSQFGTSLAWGPDHQTLHLSGRIYDDYLGGSCNAIGYLKSTDFGQTWTTYDGMPVALPATADTWDVIEAIAQADRDDYTSGSSLAGAAIAVDDSNVPHILYSKLNVSLGVRETWLATPNLTGGWDKQFLNDDITGLPAGWGAGAKGFTIDDQGHMSAILTVSDDVNEPAMFATPSSELVWLESGDGGANWTCRWVTEPDPTIPHWLPNIERPTGFNTVDVPSLIYTSGNDTTNDVLWVPLAVSIPGDANYDGTVDESDASRLAENWGKSNASWYMGDFNGDTVVDALDASIMAANWGTHTGSESNAVPEPSTFILMGLGLLVVTVARSPRV